MFLKCLLSDSYFIQIEIPKTQKPPKMYALVDCNNFFVSCERALNEGLKNQPVVVLSNNDGCVISRSDEAKALGIPMGVPAFKYKDLFEKNNVQVFSAYIQVIFDFSCFF